MRESAVSEPTVAVRAMARSDLRAAKLQSPFSTHSCHQRGGNFSMHLDIGRVM